jgi:CheY-like chemotaxis protein
VTRTVLVIDDDPLIRRLIAATLQDVGGFTVREAVDGEDGIAAAAESPPAVVLIDFEMPGITGVETCRRLRESGSDATVVMLTGSALQDTERQARAAGVDRFLTKPFSPLEVLRLVDELARRR